MKCSWSPPVKKRKNKKKEPDGVFTARGQQGERLSFDFSLEVGEFTVAEFFVNPFAHFGHVFLCEAKCFFKCQALTVLWGGKNKVDS